MSDHISDDPIWHTPIKAYSDYMKVRDEAGVGAVLRETKYQKVYETRVVAVLCFALFQAKGNPWYLQLRKNEVTDAFIMRQSTKTKGDIEILGVEVTSYFTRGEHSPKETVLEQLKKTKMFEEWHKYTDHDVVLVDLGNDYQPDFKEIHSYMRSIKSPYQLWFIQEIELEHPDTIMLLSLCEVKGVHQIRLDIGEAWHNMKEQNLRGSIRLQRTTDTNKAGTITKGKLVEEAPWETIK